MSDERAMIDSEATTAGTIRQSTALEALGRERNSPTSFCPCPDHTQPPAASGEPTGACSEGERVCDS